VGTTRQYDKGYKRGGIVRIIVGTRKLSALKRINTNLSYSRNFRITAEKAYKGIHSIMKPDANPI